MYVSMQRITPKSTFFIIFIVCVIILLFGDEDCDGCYSMGVMLSKTIVSGVIVILASLYFTKKYKEVETIIFDIENQPILETNEATDGVTFSGSGTIITDEVLTSPITKTICVYYHSIVEKYVSSGKNSYWKIIDNNIEYVPFYISDERGKLLIDIKNFDDDMSGITMPLGYREKTGQIYSEIDTKTLLRKRMYSEKSKSLFGFTKNKYRKSEFALLPNTNVYVFGMVSKINDILTLHEVKNHPLIISTKSHKNYIKQFYKGKMLIYYVHLFVLAGFFMIMFPIKILFMKNMPTSPWLTILIGGCIAIIGSLGFTMYNRIIKLKYRALNSESNIDTELKRRHTLIPQLVTVVKGYSNYENELQIKIAKIRNNISHDSKIDNNASHSGIMPVIAMLEENYPDLKASDNYKKLSLALIDTEERIAYSRKFYNQSVRKYNTLIEQFPFLLIAQTLHLQKMKFLNFSSDSLSVPEVLLTGEDSQ